MKTNRSHKPILITGSHRSGTTWVSKILGSSPNLISINEPFNPNNYYPGFDKINFDYWFTYVNENNEARYYNLIKNILDLRYNPFSAIVEIHKIKDIFAIFKTYLSSLYKRYMIHSRVLIKDPIAIFSAEWLEKRFNMNIVIIIRHPAAFASSLKRLNWAHPFSHFLKQELLMKDYLWRFEKEIKDFTTHQYNIIDQAILLWRIIYYMVKIYQDKHPNWLFIRHEDLSINPLKEFEKLSAHLSLEYTPKVKKTIKKYSDVSNSDDAPEGVSYYLTRNSKANIRNWKHRLKSYEIAKIKEGTKDIYPFFYKEEDWI